jgi:hypothetical protein
VTLSSVTVSRDAAGRSFVSLLVEEELSCAVSLSGYDSSRKEEREGSNYLSRAMAHLKGKPGCGQEQAIKAGKPEIGYGRSARKPCAKVNLI